MDEQSGRILIVGAGLAGLGLARALTRAGFTPQLIERAPGWEDAGTGMYLPANGVRALRELGLEDTVTALGARIPRQLLLDHRGRLLAEIDLDRLWGDVGPCLALPRADLHRVLRESVPVRLGRTVRSLGPLDGPVQVTFDDGSGGEYDLVVGADGLRSTVRRLVVDDRPPVPVGQHSWRFVTARPAEADAWSVQLGRRASFLTVPVARRLAYCYADVASGQAGDPGGDPIDRLRERFAGFAAPVPWLLDRLEDAGAVHVAPIEQVAEERWGRGAEHNVVQVWLVAADQLPQFLGQGQDDMNVGAWQPFLPPRAALAIYQSEVERLIGQRGRQIASYHTGDAAPGRPASSGPSDWSPTGSSRPRRRCGGASASTRSIGAG